MKVYLVGGAVRDELLQRPVKDRDYVVVGATPEKMLSLGYEQVGADFPVFLHPDSGEEYALARTERKSGKGYNGFTTEFSPTITLEDDLRRRDLTINAMAKDLQTGELIDPFNGQADLAAKTLRHVSEAFAEDPLRVLRVARFRARYGFKIANETTQLMISMVERGEVDHLTPERVWAEMEKGLGESNPVSFLTGLMICGALGRLFPEIRIGGTLCKLHECSQSACGPLGHSFEAKLMVIFSCTDTEAVMRTLEKYKASAETTRAIRVFKMLQDSAKVAPEPQELLDMLKKIDAFRRPEDLETVATTILAPDVFSTFVAKLHLAFMKMRDITFASLSPEQQSLKGQEIGRAIDELRLKSI